VTSSARCVAIRAVQQIDHVIAAVITVYSIVVRGGTHSFRNPFASEPTLPQFA
jgi:hypothetical protein